MTLSDLSVLSNTVSRRAILRLAAASSLIGVSGLLTACGGDDDDDSTDGAASATNTPAAAGTEPAQGTEPADSATEPAEGTESAEGTEPAGAQPEGEPQMGGSLRVALNADLTTMDPHMSTAAVDRQVYQLIFDKLVDIDVSLEIAPELSTDWEISDDGTTYTFNLVSGVTFHDGEPLNAEAAKFNFDRMLDEATASPRRSEILQITNVEATDETTLTLTLSQAFSPLLATLTDRAGMMISPKAIEELGDDLARNPVGTGAFTFVEWAEDDHLTVRKNDSWWKEGLPYLDEVTYVPIVDAAVRLTTLRTGDVHMIDAISARDVTQVRDDDSVVYDEVSGLGFTYITLHTAKPPFDNMALRQAVALTLDREAINETLFFGTGSPAQTPIPPSSWAYDDSVQVYQQDYDQARAKLEEGGMPDGFEFTMLVTNAPDAIQLAEAYRAQMGEVGIVANLELLEFGTLLDRSNNGDFQAISLGWSGRPDPDGNIYGYFHSDGGLNRGEYANAEVDTLLDETRAVAETAERKPIYSEVTRLIAEEAPMIFVRFPAEIKVWLPSVKNFSHVPDGMMRLDEVWLEED